MVEAKTKIIEHFPSPICPRLDLTPALPTSLPPWTCEAQGAVGMGGCWAAGQALLGPWTTPPSSLGLTFFASLASGILPFIKYTLPEALPASTELEPREGTPSSPQSGSCSLRASTGAWATQDSS